MRLGAGDPLLVQRLPPVPAKVAGGASSGFLLLLAFPPVDLRWAALLAFVPLLIVLRDASWRQGLIAGMSFGWAFFGILLYWISGFGLVAWGALTFVMALATGVFGALAAPMQRLGRWWRVLGVPLVWAGIEMLRGRYPLGGFTWGDLGYSQVGGSLQSVARIGGVYLLGLVVFAINAWVTEALFLSERVARLRVAAAIAVAVLVVPVFLPIGASGAETGTLDVAAVQGNVPKGHFVGVGRGRTGPEDEVIVRNHLAVTEQLLGRPTPGLVVWPENAFDRDPRANPALFGPVQDLVRRVGAPMVMGAILDEPNGFRNANLLLDPSGEIVDRYDKVHLVPFGEYVPLGFARRLVPALDREIPRDGIPGEEVVTFDVDGARIGTVICFESTFPELVRASVREGAQVIVVTTNNASYGTSPASAQHLAMSRMRAVEHGRPVVHAAISGISAMIAPDGEVLARASLFTPALLRETLPLTEGSTPYTRYGAAIELAIGMGAAAAVAAASWRARAKGDGAA